MVSSQSMKSILPDDGTPYFGNSFAAADRREKRNRGRFYSATTIKTETFTMADGRQYRVAPDGSFRRIRKGK